MERTTLVLAVMTVIALLSIAAPAAGEEGDPESVTPCIVTSHDPPEAWVDPACLTRIVNETSSNLPM